MRVFFGLLLAGLMILGGVVLLGMVRTMQLAALQAVVLGLLGLGSSAGAVAVPGPLGGPGAALGEWRQN